MTQGARLGSAVIFVRELERSVRFYREVLSLEVVDRSPTAALLRGAAGSQLVLRAMGGTAAHTLGNVGVQFLIWNTASQAELDACESALRERSAYRETRRTGAVTAVAGRDPDDITVMIAYPGSDQVPTQEIPVTAYAW